MSVQVWPGYLPSHGGFPASLASAYPGQYGGSSSRSFGPSYGSTGGQAATAAYMPAANSFSTTPYPYSPIQYSPSMVPQAPSHPSFYLTPSGRPIYMAQSDTIPSPASYMDPRGLPFTISLPSPSWQSSRLPGGDTTGSSHEPAFRYPTANMSYPDQPSYRIPLPLRSSPKPATEINEPFSHPGTIQYAALKPSEHTPKTILESSMAYPSLADRLTPPPLAGNALPVPAAMHAAASHSTPVTSEATAVGLEASLVQDKMNPPTTNASAQQQGDESTSETSPSSAVSQSDSSVLGSSTAPSTPTTTSGDVSALFKTSSDTASIRNGRLLESSPAETPASARSDGCTVDRPLTAPEVDDERLRQAWKHIMLSAEEDKTTNLSNVPKAPVNTDAHAPGVKQASFADHSAYSRSPPASHSGTVAAYHDHVDNRYANDHRPPPPYSRREDADKSGPDWALSDRHHRARMHSRMLQEHGDYEQYDDGDWRPSHQATAQPHVRSGRFRRKPDYVPSRYSDEETYYGQEEAYPNQVPAQYAKGDSWSSRISSGLSSVKWALKPILHGLSTSGKALSEVLSHPGYYSRGTNYHHPAISTHGTRATERHERSAIRSQESGKRSRRKVDKWQRLKDKLSSRGRRSRH